MKVEETREFLRKYGIRPRKELGQSFLLNDSIAESIVDEACLTGEEWVIDIGAGLGALTEPLLEKAGWVIAVEKDPRLCEALKERLGDSPDLFILNEDILKLDLKHLSKEKNTGRLKIVSNLPYHITSPILNYVFENRDIIELAVLTLQNEVALRVAAQPGGKQYGVLSVLSQYYTTPEILFSVQPSHFYPSPRVVSTSVRLRARETPPVSADERLLLKLLRVSFSQRRKMLKNVLKGLSLTPTLLDKISSQSGIDLRRRGETLSLVEFGRLTNALRKVRSELQSPP